MKQRRIALILVFLMCAALMLSGALLILHSDHECHQTSCPVCIILARSSESFLCLLTAFAAVGFSISLTRGCQFPSSENRTVPDWTLVRRKVKLQD